MWIFTGSSGCSLVQKLPEFTCGGALSIPRLLLRLGVSFRLQSLSSRKPAMISSTWRPFQECLENMRKSRNWRCGWFRGYALESSPLILLNFSSSCVRMEERGMQKPLGFRVETEGYNTVDSQIIRSMALHPCLQAVEDPSA